MQMTTSLRLTSPKSSYAVEWADPIAMMPARHLDVRLLAHTYSDIAPSRDLECSVCKTLGTRVREKKGLGLPAWFSISLAPLILGQCPRLWLSRPNMKTLHTLDH